MRFLCIISFEKKFLFFYKLFFYLKLKGLPVNNFTKLFTLFLGRFDSRINLLIMVK